MHHFVQLFDRIRRVGVDMPKTCLAEFVRSRDEPRGRREGRPIPHGRGEVAPFGGDVVTGEARHDDDKALAPHTDDNGDRDDRQHRLADAYRGPPEKLAIISRSEEHTSELPVTSLSRMPS